MRRTISLGSAEKDIFDVWYEQSSRSSQLPRCLMVSSNVISGTEKVPGVSWWLANEIAFGQW